MDAEELRSLCLAARKDERNTLLRSVVRNCQHIDDTAPKDEPGPMTGPAWAKVAYICGLGSTSAIELCRHVGVDPHYDCSKETLGEQ